jgi:hypothetical protein
LLNASADANEVFLFFAGIRQKEKSVQEGTPGSHGRDLVWTFFVEFHLYKSCADALGSLQFSALCSMSKLTSSAPRRRWFFMGYLQQSISS